MIEILITSDLTIFKSFYGFRSYMSAFNDAWTLLKQQMSLLPFGFATGNPAQDALAYLGAGPGAGRAVREGPMTVPQ